MVAPYTTKMATNLLCVACLAFLSSASALARDDVVLELMKQVNAKIERLEEKNVANMESANLREAELIRQIEKLNQRVNSLEEKNIELTKENHQFRQNLMKEVFGQQTPHDDITGDIRGEATDTREKKTTTSTIRSRNLEPCDAKIVKSRQAMQSTYNVAFSVYMDHDADGLSAGETLVYNQVLLNDGNGYNIQTGTFTVPTAGVYSFTFFIGERDTNQAVVALYVNTDNKVDAIAQTEDDFEDAQGGNSVMLKVAAGDIVYVKTTSRDSHLEGSARWRYTTFSGFLLYPTEGVHVVGK